MAKTVANEKFRFEFTINADPAKLELEKVEKAQMSLRRETSALRDEKARLKAQNKQGSEEWKRVSKQISENNLKIKENDTKMKQLRKQIGITALTMKQLRTEASQLRIQLQNLTPGTEKYDRLNARLKEVNTRIKELNNTSRASEGVMSRWAGGFNKYAAMGASLIATLTGVVFKAQQIIDFNGKMADSMSNVRKTTGLNQQQVEDLAKELGSFSTRTTRIELLQLAEEAGRLGIEGVDNIKSFVQIANQMKVALGDDLGEEQIREVGKMVTIYKVGEKEGKNFEEAMLALGSSINEVSASGANQASFLVDFLKRTAGISDVANISAQDMVGLAAAFDEVGQSQEISATAINKFFGSAAADVEKFAEIAGVSIAEYSRMLDEDANEAMIVFLEGLKEGDPTMQQMEKRLEGIELGGTRGKQAISALASSTENLRNKQDIANRSLKEATSLTNEYNIKNENFAALLDRIGKFFRGGFVGMASILESITRGFADLFGIVDDTQEAFIKETRAKAESGKESARLARESSALLDRYNELTKDGIIPTGEAKKELDLITLQLRDRLGESVMAIDAETGMYKLNTEAVKAQIKIKRLAANEAAASLASDLQGLKDRQKEIENERMIAEKEFDLRKDFFDKKNKDDLESIKNSSAMSQMEKLRAEESLEGYKELGIARGKIQKLINETNNLTEREIELNKALAESFFTPEDVEAFFKVDVPKEEELPQEGDKKTIGGLTMIYKNGKWSIQSTIDITPDSGDGEKAFQNLATQLKSQRQKLEDETIALIQDEFIREREQEKLNHARRIEDLKSQQIDLLTVKKEDKAAAIAINKSLDDRIELEKAAHIERLATLELKGIQDEMARSEQSNAQALQALQLRHNKELAAFKGTDQERKQLIKDQQQEELDIQEQHLEDMITMFTAVMNGDNFKDIPTWLLSDDDVAVLNSRIEELKLKLSELGLAKSNLGSGDSSAEDLAAAQGALGKVDIFGFSAQDWVTSLNNMDSALDKINLLGMGLESVGQIWSGVSNMLSAREDRELQEFTQNQDRKREALDRRLESGYLNQRQYDKAVVALDQERAKKEAELEYKRAKRQQITALADIASTTAMAVMRTNAAYALIPGGAAIAAGINTATIAQGALQAGLVLAAPLPARGYEDGLYPMMREQDGKVFNVSYGGEPTTQLVSRPTHFIAGETQPEMIIDGDTFKGFTPQFRNSLFREIAAVKGYENGFNMESSTGAPSFGGSSSTSPELMALIAQNNAYLKHLIDNGTIAYMSRDMRNTQLLQEELDRLNKIQNNNRV